MPKHKPIETKFIDIATALQFQNWDNLLALLCEGSLVAQGRLNWIGLTDDEHPGAWKDIPMTDWADYEFVPGPNILRDNIENFYVAIRLPRAALNEWIGKAPNIGGRPLKYDWDGKFLPEILKDAFENEPQSVDAWVRRASELTIWGSDGGPDEKTLRTKLGPFFKCIFSKP